MRSLKNWTWVGLIAAMAMAPAAQAAGNSMRTYLESIEQNWQGSGENSQSQPNGSRLVTPYDLEVAVHYLGGDNWEVHNTRRLPNGYVEFNRFQFGVRGDRLQVGPNFPNEWVELVETTDTSLVYRAYRFDPRWGNTLRYTFDTHTVQALPSNEGQAGTVFLDGHNTTELNGRLISDDHFSLTP